MEIFLLKLFLAVVIASLVMVNIWHYGRRAKMTAAERKIDDDEIRDF